MTKRKDAVERRKHRRFQIPSGAFVELCPRGAIVGKVVDISLGGLAFGYIDGQKPFRRSSELHMFCLEEGLCLRDVRFKTVWDFEIPNEVPVNSEAMRQSGVRFKKLGRDQRSQLKYFIEKYSMGEGQF